VRKLFRLIVSMTVLLSTVAEAAVATVENGILTGATGVEVNGALYSVRLLDGSCETLFSGCAVSSFAFTHKGDAVAAAQALIDQVFIDGSAGSFDSDPGLTAGCVDPGRLILICSVQTPWSVGLDLSGRRTVSFAITENADPNSESGAQNGVSANGLDISTTDTTGRSNDFFEFAWASWSPVPEPGTVMSISIGLLCLVPLLRLRAPR
jgi:hypothetical protein